MIALLDSSAVIYWIEGSLAQQNAVEAVLLKLKAQHPDAQLAVSRLGVMECRVKPLCLGSSALLNAYESFFERMQVVELSAGVVTMATDLRASFGLKTPDALQAASALSLGSDTYFITADNGFERVPALRTLLLQ